MRDINRQINGVIYKTTNTANGKWYIGKDENNNPDYLGSGKVLSRAIAKYGRHCFKKEILAESTNRKELAKLEKELIAKFNAAKDPMSYNIAEGGRGGHTMAGYTEEQKALVIEKQSNAHKGKSKSPEHKRKISESKLGVPMAQTTIEKRSETRKRLYAEGKLSVPKGKDWTGLHHSETTKQKISASKKGVPNSKVRKVTEEVWKNIKRDIDAKLSIAIIGKKYNLAKKTIYQYINSESLS